MRFLLAGTLATLTAAGLATIRPPVLTEDERAVLYTDASAGYGWKVVRASWTGEQFSLPAAPADPTLPIRAG